MMHGTILSIKQGRAFSCLLCSCIGLVLGFGFRVSVLGIRVSHTPPTCYHGEIPPAHQWVTRSCLPGKCQDVDALIELKLYSQTKVNLPPPTLCPIYILTRRRLIQLSIPVTSFGLNYTTGVASCDNISPVCRKDLKIERKTNVT